MIISHKYRFIFLKTSKTAGTSLEIALSKFCGDDDIITPISRADENIRSHLGYRGPQNYLSPISDTGLGNLAMGQTMRGGRLVFFNHISAALVRSRIGENVWDQYYKFCFERNPWDRFISFYYFNCQSEPRPTMSAVLESGMPRRLKKLGIDVYTIDGKIAVDRVCLYENMQAELERLRVQLGLPEKLHLPWAKSGFRTDRRSYRDLLNPEEMAMIGELFRDEINLFGYQC
jgi:hypothetical protein